MVLLNSGPNDYCRLFFLVVDTLSTVFLNSAKLILAWTLLLSWVRSVRDSQRKIIFGDSSGVAHHTPPEPLVGWGGDTPPYPPLHSAPSVPILIEPWALACHSGACLPRRLIRLCTGLSSYRISTKCVATSCGQAGEQTAGSFLEQSRRSCLEPAEQ